MKEADSSPTTESDSGDFDGGSIGANAESQRARMNPMLWFIVIAAVTIAIDQVTKFLAERHLVPGQRTDLLGDFLGLRLVYNPGAAFSFGTGATWLLTLLATVVAVVIIRIARRVTSWSWIWALSLLLGGAVGNLIDRFFKAPGFPEGHVVDFIDYGIFVGNVADIAIVLAAIFMVYLGMRGTDITDIPQGEVDSSDA